VTESKTLQYMNHILEVWRRESYTHSPKIIVARSCFDSGRVLGVWETLKGLNSEPQTLMNS
jgi:hypothetical protein